MLALLIALLSSAGLSDYAGRYESSDGTIVVVEARDGALSLRPLFWSVSQPLVAAGEDRFSVAERPERIVTFHRDGAGVVSVSVRNMGLLDGPMARIRDDRPRAAELLRAGRAGEAARELARERKDAAATAASWGAFFVAFLPTKAAVAADFLAAVAERHPDDAKLQAVLGDALVAAGSRAEAVRRYQHALWIDPKNESAAAGLRMLGGKEDDLPLPLDVLFAPPADEEIAAVREQWARRDLRPRDVQIVQRGTLGEHEVRIVAHRIYGAKHYGAVLVPKDAKPGCCPVVVEAKGVSPSYFPLDLTKAYGPKVLRGEAVVYFLPSYRGEVLLFDGERHQSEGDRTDVWDGATDDLIAFTSAALRVTPEAAGERMCVFGKSRGGTVALLAGIRDRRFDCVVGWSGPADHFFEMAVSGLTPRERVAEGLRRKSDVTGLAGQFLETWLRAPLAGERDLAETRLHLLASSPLWFAESLPPAQLHYGEEDNMVAVRNGRALERRIPEGRAEVIFYSGAGHDLDPEQASRHTRRFLLERLRAPE